jgi:hypothetical protein
MMQPVPLDVLPYAEFGRMRLGSFVPPGTEIVEQSYVEWMDGLGYMRVSASLGSGD